MLMLFYMGGNITIHFTLLILFADLICYYMFILYLSRKCVLKNIYIIAFASHSMKANGEVAEKLYLLNALNGIV